MDGQNLHLTKFSSISKYFVHYVPKNILSDKIYPFWSLTYIPKYLVVVKNHISENTKILSCAITFLLQCFTLFFFETHFRNIKHELIFFVKHLTSKRTINLRGKLFDYTGIIHVFLNKHHFYKQQQAKIDKKLSKC